jgi:hypothetical protein
MDIVWEVTREHSSTTSLKKPFKTPFKTPLLDAPQNILLEERQPRPGPSLSGNKFVDDGRNIHAYERIEQKVDEDLPRLYSCQSLIQGSR